MAKYTCKYKVNQKVEVYGKPGMITAIHIRDRHRAYEFSYSDDGKPVSVTVEQGEITDGEHERIGFKQCKINH